MVLCSKEQRMIVVFLITLFFILILAFLRMGYNTLLMRGVPNFSRHRVESNGRRRKGDSIEITDTQGIPIMRVDLSKPPGYTLYDSSTSKYMTPPSLDGIDGFI